MASPLLLALALLLPLQGPPNSGLASSTWTANEGLPQNTVTGIDQGPEGDLWLSTLGGLGRFDGTRFEAFDAGTNPELPTSRFTKVLVTRDGSVWAGTPQETAIHLRDGEFTVHELPTPVHTLLEDGSGTIWATAHGGLFRFDGDRFERVLLGHAYSAVATHDGAIWASDRMGMTRLSDGVEERRGAAVGLPDSIAWAAVEDEDGGLWIGYDEGLFQSSDASHRAFREVPGAPQRIRSLVFDGEGMIWVAGEGGLHRSVEGRSGFEVVDPDTPEALFADSRGTVWLGVRGAGLTAHRRSPLTDANAWLGLAPGNAWMCAAGRGGELWIGTSHVARLVRGATKEGRKLPNFLFAAVAPRSGGLWLGLRDRLLFQEGDDEVEIRLDSRLIGTPSTLVERSDGQVLLGTNRGLFRVGTDGVQRIHPELVDAICLLETPDGVLWAGGVGGLARLHEGKWTRLTSSDGLAPGTLRTLHLDERGVLWAGSYGGGISRIEGSNVRRLDRSVGLANDFVSAILPDDDGRLWLSTNAGPAVVRRADLDAVARGERDGFASLLFRPEIAAREANGGHENGGYRAPDGRLWLPTIGGVTIIDPKLLPIDEAPPRPRIEALTLGEGRKLDARFAGLGWSAPERVQMQYRLAGQESGWTDVGRDRSVHYPYVPPGEHRLELRARNGYGPWSEPAVAAVVVPARFTETAAFLVCLVLVASGLTFGAARVQLRRSRAREAHLEELVTQRETALRSLADSQSNLSRLSRDLLTAQDAERSRISAELHDDVTQRIAALAMQAEVVESQLGVDEERSRRQLGEVVHIAQQLAGDVQQLSRRLHPLGLRTLGLQEAIRRECEAFERRGGVAVDLASEAGDVELESETEIAVFRILQESLHNIEKHAQATVVEVTTERAGEDLLLRVADRGRGFAETEAETGLGLLTMRERAASVGGQVQLNSSVGQGTTLELRVPVGGGQA